MQKIPALALPETWPTSVKFAAAALAVSIATIVELPEAFDAPGKPFLLYFIVSALCTLTLGLRPGLFAVASSSALSALFFDPVFTFWVSNRNDLIAIVAFTAIGSASVLTFAKIRASITAHEEQRRRLMLGEMAHRVANNFTAAVATISRISAKVLDGDAKQALDEAINQLRIFARVHSLLRPDADEWLFVNSKEFLGGLCVSFGQSAGRIAELRFEHSGAGVMLPLHQAVALGLIVNELVTNSVKYAFPEGSSGVIDVSFKAHRNEWCVCVADNGAGNYDAPKGTGKGLGLVEGLAQQLGGKFSREQLPRGTRCNILVPWQPDRPGEHAKRSPRGHLSGGVLREHC
jgi:two-component system, sensor histidine kinase PdtaS